MERFKKKIKQETNFHLKQIISKVVKSSGWLKCMSHIPYLTCWAIYLLGELCMAHYWESCPWSVQMLSVLIPMSWEHWKVCPLARDSLVLSSFDLLWRKKPREMGDTGMNYLFCIFGACSDCISLFGGITISESQWCFYLFLPPPHVLAAIKIYEQQ